MLQVSIAVKEHQLPILCCHDECGVPLAWRDFNSLSRHGHLKLSDLAASALSAFVLANRDKACFCKMPDCPMVYRVTSEDKAEVFACPECSARTCTACHQEAHDGMTCIELRTSKEETGSVDDWVKEDPKNRKACPGCGSPIQKMGGCNRMNCTACSAIFCWLCCERFNTVRECYDHLAKTHGGFFAE